VLPPVLVTSTGVDRWGRQVGPRPRRDRIAVAVAAAATILPVWVAAVRVGVGRLVPVGDTAIMALRAPDVLSKNPPLIGMPASSASGAGAVVHFPAAWQLYWLAVPVKVLGATWGTVVAMGALNTIWLGLAIWLVWRNLSTPAALWVIAVLGVFCWSIGSGMLIESWPLRMVIVPFLCVVIAAWWTAAGDHAAVVVLAVAANYAWLDHLVLALVVPLVAFAGCVGFVVVYFRSIRSDPDHRPLRRRRCRRSLLAAGAVTFVMWLPALVQQVVDSPGNLGQLVSGSDGGSPAIHSASAAVHVVASLVGRPPFWFRGTLDDPTFYRAHHTGFVAGSMTGFDLAVVIVGVVVFAVLGVLAVRARDRIGLALLGIAAATVVGSLATVYLAPVTTALVPEYLFSVWVTAAVVWLAVIVNAVRRIEIASAPASACVALGVTVLFGILDVPSSATGYTARTAENTLARHMSREVIDRIDGKGPVAVTLENTFVQNADYLSALLVELRAGGIAFCYPTPNTSLYAFIPDCDSGPGTTPQATIVIADKPASDPPSGDVLFREPIFPHRSKAPVAELDARIGRWLRTRSRLSLTDAATRPFLGPMIPQFLVAQARALAPRDGNLGHLVDDPTFQRMIITWWQRADARADPLFVGQPVSPVELYEWANAKYEADLTLWVTRRPAAG